MFVFALLLLPSIVRSYSLFDFNNKPRDSDIGSSNGASTKPSPSRSHAPGSHAEKDRAHPSDHNLLPPTEATLSTGLYHTCAIVRRAGVDCGAAPCGPAKCWGHDDRGQATPPPGVMFRQLSAGGSFTCGLELGGKVACWGDIDHPPRSLAALSREERAAVRRARRLQQTAADAARASSPHVHGGGYYVSVSSGTRHACALSRDAAVHCWGRNDFGEGQPPGGAFVQVSAGNAFTCGVRPTGAVHCWGKNDAGQSAPPAYPAHVFRQISASVGGDHACGILMEASSRRATDIRCWGNNGRGQSATQEGAVGEFRQVSAGTRTTCAVRAEADAALAGDAADAPPTDIHCWGSRAHAVLEHVATTRDRSYRQLQLGQDHACAVTSSAAGEEAAGSLQCWWMGGADFQAHRVPVGLEMAGGTPAVDRS